MMTWLLAKAPAIATLLVGTLVAFVVPGAFRLPVLIVTVIAVVWLATRPSDDEDDTYG